MCATSEGHHRNWGVVAGDTATGAASGAAIGSVIPGVGTAIGAGVGAVGGFLTGLFSSDEPDPLPPPVAPPPPPDLADVISKRAELAKQMRLMGSGSGTFLTGPLGDTSKTPGSKPVAGGY